MDLNSGPSPWSVRERMEIILMYQDKLVLAMKVNGKVLREFKDAVYIPFGSEYSITLKNLNSLRALVRVTVDGQNATEGTSGLIVPANGTVDLERFIKNGNLSGGNRFKFIERTQRIEDGPRGIKLEDGLIRVEFEFEKQAAKIEDIYHRHHYVHDWYRYPTYVPPNFPGIWSTINAISGSETIASTGVANLNNVSSASFSAHPTAKSATLTSTAFRGARTMNIPVSDTVDAFTGITVPGSVSEQKFEQGAWFPVDGQKHVMILKLMGVHNDQPIVAPITVKTKQRCSTCGHVNKSTAKFCSECGTGLELA